MPEIALRARDGTVRAVTVLDDEDFERFGHLPWCLCNSYAYSRLGLLHRLIMEAPEGIEVDHRNLDKLDNRRSNLRFATPQQQRQNIPAVGTTSRHRGVSFDSKTRSRNKWRAQVKVNGCRVLDKRFATEEEAAAAAAEARKRVMTHV